MAANMPMNPAALAFDKASVRTIDADGRMHVAKTHISKANVCPYYGKEIPGYEALGLDANKVYRLYRDPAELEKGADTFNRNQLMLVHGKVSADEPQKQSVVGTIGSDAVFEAPYLNASLCIWDAEAIALVEAEKLDELSAAYRYVPVMTPGLTPDGEAYDGRMTEIQGNHLALVEVGRAGSDVIVADSNPFIKESSAMKKTALGRALMAAFSAASPKIAQDSNLPKLLGEAVKSKFDKSGVIKQLIAMDSDLDPEKAGEIIDAVTDVEKTPEPVDPKKLAKDDDLPPSKFSEVIEFLKTKGLDAPSLETINEMLSKADAPAAIDADMMKPADVDAKVETAMDAMRIEFRALEAAKSAVRTTVGDVLGMDSAEQVYRFALDHLKVDHKDMPAAGLGRLFAVASERKADTRSPVIAADAATVGKVFPGIARFRNI
jgi:hypothetical protein